MQRFKNSLATLVAITCHLHMVLLKHDIAFGGILVSNISQTIEYICIIREMMGLSDKKNDLILFQCMPL